MCYQLHTIVKRTVPLDIDVLAVAVGVGYLKQFICVIIVLSCSVYLKLNSEESIGITVENRLRFVHIIVDTSVTVDFLVITFRAVVVSV